MTDDRRRESGFYFTGRQFAGLLGAILSTQLAVNWFAAKSFVTQVAVEAIHTHNTDPEAHARALMLAQQERMEQTKQIIVLQTKIDGLETMIRSLAAQGVFDVKTNGNGRH